MTFSCIIQYKVNLYSSKLTLFAEEGKMNIVIA